MLKVPWTFEAVMNFMEKVSNSKGGEKIARDMLDSGSPVKHETKLGR